MNPDALAQAYPLLVAEAYPSCVMLTREPDDTEHATLESLDYRAVTGGEHPLWRWLLAA